MLLDYVYRADEVVIYRIDRGKRRIPLLYSIPSGTGPIDPVKTGGIPRLSEYM